MFNELHKLLESNQPYSLEEQKPDSWQDMTKWNVRGPPPLIFMDLELCITDLMAVKWNCVSTTQMFSLDEEPNEVIKTVKAWPQLTRVM